MHFKLQLIVIPVSDVDRAKAVYLQTAGLEFEVDGTAKAGGRSCAERAGSAARGEQSLVEGVAAYERVMLPRGFDTIDSSLRMADPAVVHGRLMLSCQRGRGFDRTTSRRPGQASTDADCSCTSSYLRC